MNARLDVYRKNCLRLFRHLTCLKALRRIDEGLSYVKIGLHRRTRPWCTRSLFRRDVEYGLQRFGGNRIRAFCRFLHIFIIGSTMVISRTVKRVFLRCFVRRIRKVRKLRCAVVFVFLRLHCVGLKDVRRCSLRGDVTPFRLRFGARLPTKGVLT